METDAETLSLGNPAKERGEGLQETGVKDTKIKPTESTNLGPQGLTETELLTRETPWD